MALIGKMSLMEKEHLEVFMAADCLQQAGSCQSKGHQTLLLAVSLG